MRTRWVIAWIVIVMLSVHRFASPFLLHAEDQLFDLTSSEYPPHVCNELIVQLTPATKIAITQKQNATPLTGIAQLDSLNSIYDVKAIVPLIGPQANINVQLSPTRLAQMYLLKFARASDVTEIMHRYQKLSDVEHAEVNQIYFSHGSKTKKAVIIDQRQLIEAASHIEHKNPIIIGIIDTGLDWQKKHLLANLWKNPKESGDGLDNDANGFVDDIWGWNFVDPELLQYLGLSWKNKPEDKCGHGSMIADICNQICNYPTSKNNSKPNRLMILKAGFAMGDGTIIFTTATTARAIIYAANHGANILNISWGSHFPSLILKQAIHYAVAKGCLIIASAGNENSQRPMFPAALENVCAVAAVDSANKKLGASNYGYWIDVTAPASVQIQDSLATRISSTSIAAAYVTGFAGLIAASKKNFNADSLQASMIWSSDNIYPMNPEYIGELGAGKVNLKRALQCHYQPNLILQNCIARNRSQSAVSDEIIPLVVHVKNLSYPANHVRIRFTTDDPIAEIQNSELIIPALNYRQKFSNESEPFMLQVKQAITDERKILFQARLTAANGFSSSQEFMVAIGKSPPQNLTLINDSPVTLYWSAEQKFIGYHIYRRQDDQDSFHRLSEAPLLTANFIDPTADAGRSYHYFITGIDQSHHETPASNIISLEVSAGSSLFSSSTHETAQRITLRSAFPPGDTTLVRGDSLQFYVTLDTKDAGALKYSWILNDRLINQARDSVFAVVADSLPYPKNSLKVAISDSDAVISHSWHIEIAQSATKFQFYPAGDTAIAVGDTLTISFDAGKFATPTRGIQWWKNGVYEKLAIGERYTLRTSLASSGIDTITLKYQSADTAFSHHWRVAILARTIPPRILSFSPMQDTTIAWHDTLKLFVTASDPAQNSLSFRWYVNGQVDTTARQAFYSIVGNNQPTKTDTIVVIIADQESTIRHQWLIHYFKKKNSIPRIITCQPAIDAELSKSDSIQFRISCYDPDGDRLKFAWHLNSAIDSTAFDSTYFFQPHVLSRYDDTLAVAISDADTTIQIQWVLRSAFGRKSNARSASLLYWVPEQDTIFATGDSIVFAANFPMDWYHFHWSINNEVDSSRSDSVLVYRLSSYRSIFVTITVAVVAPDTMFWHRWIVQKNQLRILPAPTLIFPIKGDHITEEELFVWQNDSTLASADSVRSSRFVIQLAKDTTFKQIVSVDTCKTSSIAVKNCSGFNQIAMGKPYFWRVKLLAENHAMSIFKKCDAPFYYYPLFARVENFSGQKSDEGFIDLFWMTSYEKHCAGFNLYRSTSRDDNFKKINEQLITGATNFTYQDRTVAAGITYFYKLEDICVNGRKKLHQPIEITAVEPKKYSLDQNFPNPFNSTTSFKYEIPTATNVRIEVFNVLGRKVKTLVDADKEAGFYTVAWDGIDDQGKNVVSGIYFYHMFTPKFNMTHKMIVVR